MMFKKHLKWMMFKNTADVDNDQKQLRLRAMEIIIRADGSLKMYLVFSHNAQKALAGKDLEILWKLVKAKHGSTRPEEGYERVFVVLAAMLICAVHYLMKKLLNSSAASIKFMWERFKLGDGVGDEEENNQRIDYELVILSLREEIVGR
ncbi:hypothetical protein Tco_0047647 [Tanacetum coccineum]